MQVEAPRIAPLARNCIAAGAVLMVVAVMLGAFGAHVLQSQLTPKQLASFQTGVHYHMLHSLGLLLVGIVAQVTAAGARLRWSARLMLAGIAFFSGSIYLMTAGAPRWLGMVAPSAACCVHGGVGIVRLARVVWPEAFLNNHPTIDQPPIFQVIL